jgi:hypothetical protein
VKKFIVSILLEVVKVLIVAVSVWAGFACFAAAGFVWAAYVAHPWFIIFGIYFLTGILGVNDLDLNKIQSKVSN